MKPKLNLSPNSRKTRILKLLEEHGAMTTESIREAFAERYGYRFTPAALREHLIALKRAGYIHKVAQPFGGQAMWEPNRDKRTPTRSVYHELWLILQEGEYTAEELAVLYAKRYGKPISVANVRNRLSYMRKYYRRLRKSQPFGKPARWTVCVND